MDAAVTTVRKTITVTDSQNDGIKAQIDSGAYANDSEVLRDLIRKAQRGATEIEAIRAALIDGAWCGRKSVGRMAQGSLFQILRGCGAVSGPPRSHPADWDERPSQG